MAALLSQPYVPCVHALDDTPWPVVYPHGLSDPTCAALRPEETLDKTDGIPVVVIMRDVNDSWKSFKAMASRGDFKVHDRALWERWALNVKQFALAAKNVRIADYAELEDPYIVKDLARHVGVDLSIPYIKHMQLLKIEQHQKCLQFVRSRSR